MYMYHADFSLSLSLSLSPSYLLSSLTAISIVDIEEPITSSVSVCWGGGGGGRNLEFIIKALQYDISQYSLVSIVHSHLFIPVINIWPIDECYAWYIHVRVLYMKLSTKI